MLKIDELGEMPRQSEPYSHTWHWKTCCCWGGVLVFGWSIRLVAIKPYNFYNSKSMVQQKGKFFLPERCRSRMVPMFTWAHRSSHKPITWKLSCVNIQHAHVHMEGGVSILKWGSALVHRARSYSPCTESIHVPYRMSPYISYLQQKTFSSFFHLWICWSLTRVKRCWEIILE